MLKYTLFNSKESTSNKPYLEIVYSTEGAVLTKTLSTSTLQEGTQSTVTITIKNTGSTPISNLKIKDSLPSAFKLISGTLTKSIPSLTAEQSTTLQYTFEPYGIGSITLPEATATYADENGNYYTAKSNTAKIEIIPSMITTPQITITPTTFTPTPTQTKRPQLTISQTSLKEEPEVGEILELPVQRT